MVTYNYHKIRLIANMSKSEINFTFFSSVIIRIPAYPINFYKNLTEGFSITSDNVKELLDDSQIKEALYLASPELFSEIEKWENQENYPIHKAEKIKFSILKYLIRMSTRCTPFGLFAACGSGRLSDSTKIKIGNNFYRKTRLDMQFAANLTSELIKDETIQNQILFYPNTTLYQLGDFYRYIEYTLEDNKRKYSLEAVRKSDYLDLILQKAVDGKNQNDLAAFLISDEINKNDALEFVQELIANQILVSELEPKLTDCCAAENLESKININNKAFTEIETVNNEIETRLLNIDTTLGNEISSYKEITDIVLEAKVSFNKKYLFQTDLFLESNDFQLDKKYITELSKAINLLDIISKKPENTSLESFKKSFIKRYENQTIPLVKALDIETGIGYLQKTVFDTTPLLDSIKIKEKTNSDQEITLSKSEKVIYNKLQNTLQNNKTSINLKCSDFENPNVSTQNMPDTFSCVFEIVLENEKEWIVIQSIGGSSAANLLARFCYGNQDIYDFANDITQYESEITTDKIIAEIIHLPESRTGNILRRPNFRDYEIPYLGQSSLPISNQINITDLVLFIKNNRLVLWSKKHDKEVIPKLTNAHNYSQNSLPIYHFLCDMQFENHKSALGLSTKFEKLFDYLPRITIKNCIVSKAKWIFSKTKHPDFFQLLVSKNDFNPELFRSALNFTNIRETQYVSLMEGDNALIIDLANDTCIKMFVETIKNKTQFILEEFLFPSNTVVNGNNERYANQFIVGLKRNKI